MAKTALIIAFVASLLVLAFCFLYAIHMQASPCISGDLLGLKFNLETAACRVNIGQVESARAP